MGFKSICMGFRFVIPAVVLSLPLPAGSQTLYFGEDDFGFSSSTSVHSRSYSFPNSSATRSSFLGSLTSDVGTETFEGLAHGLSHPSLTFPGAGTATISGSGVVRDYTVYGDWVWNDRYPVSGEKFYDTNPGTFRVIFSGPVAAFGFYAVDAGDVGGQLWVDFISSSGTNSVKVPHALGSGQSTTGNAFYFGMIDYDNPFDEVQFRIVGSSSDWFAFDDMTIASAAQVVPEPATLGLVGLGLVALGLARQSRRS